MEKLFHLKENNTTVRTEIVAGLTTFMTMAYIIALNPNLLDRLRAQAARSCGTACSLPPASPPPSARCAWPFWPTSLCHGSRHGLNSFFAVVAGNVAAMLNTDYTSAFQAVLCIILVEGIVFLLLSVFNIRDKIVHAIPLACGWVSAPPSA